MKIFVDFHHYGLFRGLLSTLSGRCGHEAYGPDESFAPMWRAFGGGIFHESMWDKDWGAWPDREGWPPHGTIGFSEFRDTEWDILLCTRIDTMPLFTKWRDKYHPNAKMVCHAGNEGTQYSWADFPNLISSDTFTYNAAPPGVRKIMLPQELNLQCGESYTPITHANARRIGTFINCFTDMTNAQFVKHDFDTRECPYCQAPTDEVRYDPYGYWKTVRGQLPGHEFLLYGGGNEGEASELLSEGEIPGKVRDTSLNLHMKLHEGWGHSLLQTVYAGRPALVPQSFYAFRTAGRYLIPGETCFEFDLNSPESCAGLIRELTSDIPWLDRVGRRCYDIAQTLFDWDFHAEKLNRWLHDLQ